MQLSALTNIRELFSAGGPILILLLLLSVFSVAVILERFIKLRNAVSYSRKLISYCRHPIHSGNFSKIEDACRKEAVRNTPAAVLLSRLCKERDRSREELEKIAESVIDWEIAKLQRRLSILGTLGSITPFIGLFGTVIGVMHAFKDLAANTSVTGAGASIVAAGIAEALVNTAAGLFVAIPAVIAYNYFLSKTTYFAHELESIAEEFLYSTPEEL